MGYLNGGGNPWGTRKKSIFVRRSRQNGYDKDETDKFIAKLRAEHEEAISYVRKQRDAYRTLLLELVAEHGFDKDKLNERYFALFNE